MEQFVRESLNYSTDGVMEEM